MKLNKSGAPIKIGRTVCVHRPGRGSVCSICYADNSELLPPRVEVPDPDEQDIERYRRLAQDDDLFSERRRFIGDDYD